MVKEKLKIIKKIEMQECWVCKGKGCKICNGGMWEESQFFFIYKGQAFDADTIA